MPDCHATSTWSRCYTTQNSSACAWRSRSHPESLAVYQHRQRLEDVLVLSGPDRRAYGAFGFGSGTVPRVYLDPGWLRYLQLVMRGRRPDVAHEDALQLGGEVLIDGEGRVRWVDRSRGPEDRRSIPANEEALGEPRDA